MRTQITCIGLFVAVATCIYSSDSAFAQVSPGQSDSRSSGSSSQRSSSSSHSSGVVNGNATSSRSVSFVKDGKRVAIAENSQGITVSIDGQSVRAKNTADLKERYPEKYRLYEEHLRYPNIRTYGFSGGSASAGGSASGSGVPGQSGQFSENSTVSRNVSLNENGKQISITQDKTGITVSVNGKRVKGRNAAELKKNSVEAFKIFKKHMGGTNSGLGHQPDARTLMQQQLKKMLDANSDNPRMRNLIQRMLQNASQ